MNKKTQNNRVIIRNLIIFIIVVLTIGWLGKGLDMLMGNPGPESLGMLLWLITPMVVSFLLRAIAGDGWKDLGIKPNIKGNIIWYVIAIIIFPFVTLLVLIIGRSIGLIAFPNYSIETLSLIFQSFIMGLIPQLIKNVFEESAWRGYLVPKVFSLRINDFVGHMVVGLVWGAWHIPYYLFFLDQSILSKFTTLNLSVFILSSIITMISWAFVFNELRLITNSIWPAILMHMVEDAFLNQLFMENYIQIKSGTDWIISPMNGVVSIIIFILIGFCIRRYRKKKSSL